MKSFLLSAVLILLFATAAFAAVDTAIIATDRTSVDGMVAAAAGSKVGAPVFIAEDGAVSQATIDAIKSTGASTVAIVGGPAVVSEDAEASLQAAGFSVVRLWGIERTGTALEVARYFFTEGGCALLVDDTMDSSADMRRLAIAANLAAHHKCALIPVQHGDLPSSVMDALAELDISEVHYAGHGLATAARAKLATHLRSETTGSDDEIESKVEAETGASANMVVIVAAPNWPHALAIGSHPNANSVVKILSSASQADRVIAFVQAHNITDVRVVGNPALAEEIASKLSAAGINATKVSGERASEVARAAWSKSRSSFEKIRNDRLSMMSVIRSQQKEHMRAMLNSTENDFDAERLELDASSVNATELQTQLDAALQLLQDAKNKLAGGDVDGARKLWAEARAYFTHKWGARERIKWEYREKLAEEEDNIDNLLKGAEERIDKLSDAVAKLRDKCASSERIDALLARAAGLRDDVREKASAGDYRHAAALLREAKTLIKQVQHMRDVCEKRGDIPEFAKTIAERHRMRGEGSGKDGGMSGTGRNANASVNASINASANASGTGRAAETMNDTIIIEKTDSGFSPSSVKIKAGTKVRWVNRAWEQTRPASAIHPTHSVYPGSGIEKCGTAEQASIFDACKGLANGETFEFTFNERGEWRYHDHLNTKFTGRIAVE